MANQRAKENYIVIDSLHALDEESVLETVISSGEGKKLEFKSGLPNVDVISKDIAAFANTDGGIILYGVGDDGSIIGLSGIEIQKFQDVVMGSLQKVTPAPKSMSWKLVLYKGKHLGAVFVRPESGVLFFVKKVLFRRVGTTNLELSDRDFLAVRDDRYDFGLLRISELAIKRFISMADEDAFTEVLLVPFLRHLGFRSVLWKGHRDKTLEFGQDIRSFKYQLPTGHWLYFAAQVKTEDIIYSASESKRSSNIDTVLIQVKMAFDHEMFDAETNTVNLPDHVLLVTTGKINEGARLYLSRSLYREKRRRILMWEGDYLLERIIDEGLPKGCQVEIRKYIEQTLGVAL